MKEEKWIKWEPLENIPWKVSVDSVEKIKDSLVMNFHEFKKPESQLRIVFNTGVRFYAKSIETCRLTTIASIYEKYGNDLYKWSFFKVLDSAHLDWLKRESNLKSKDLQLTHYVIIESDSVIDIITTSTPLIEWL